jgi:carbamoyl-phosphate synthase large subunit
MINCNPETVSTDYDTSDRLYFEPLTLEDVLAVIELEQPEGVIVQFGGQTPLRLAAGPRAAGVPPARARASTRSTPPRTAALRRAARRGSATRRRHTRRRATVEEALAAGGRGRLPAAGAPELRARRTRDGDRLLAARTVDAARRVPGLARTGAWASGPRQIYLDRFLENAIEVDVDALCDGEEVWIGGIMQHVEEAGIHSGDSACVLPPHSLGGEMLERIREQTRGIALALGVVGLINVQFAIVGHAPACS